MRLEAAHQAELAKPVPDRASLEAITEYKLSTEARAAGLRKSLNTELIADGAPSWHGHPLSRVCSAWTGVSSRMCVCTYAHMYICKYMCIFSGISDPLLYSGAFMHIHLYIP